MVRLYSKTAPENIPPNIELDNSWNKSIIFSLGLIGFELLTFRTADQFYLFKGTQLKFNFEDYQKWLRAADKIIANEVFNLIMLMTHQNPWTRLKLGEFEALLAPYKNSILEGQQKSLEK